MGYLRPGPSALLFHSSPSTFWLIRRRCRAKDGVLSSEDCRTYRSSTEPTIMPMPYCLLRTSFQRPGSYCGGTAGFPPGGSAQSSALERAESQPVTTRASAATDRAKPTNEQTRGILREPQKMEIGKRTTPETRFFKCVRRVRGYESQAANAPGKDCSGYVRANWLGV